MRGLQPSKCDASGMNMLLHALQENVARVVWIAFYLL